MAVLTTPWLINEMPHMLSKTKMLKCSFKYFSTHCTAMYAAEKMLPLLPNKAISKHVWVELIHFQILYGHELITFSCLSHFIFNYLSASLVVMVHSLVQIRLICHNSDVTLMPHYGRWHWILNQLSSTKIAEKS